MVRLSKQTRDRQCSFRRPRSPGKRTGPKKDTLKNGYKEHQNALEGMYEGYAFIPKMSK